MNENDKQAEPVAWLCEWEEGWHQYHDAADPLPDEWDDAPKKITPLYAYPAAAINEQLLDRLKQAVIFIEASFNKPPEGLLITMKSAIAAAQKELDR